MNELKKKIAILGEFGLGDSLIQTVMAQNLIHAGYDVRFFSTVLSQLAAWFPQLAFEPSISEETVNAELSNYAKIVTSGLPPNYIQSHIKHKWISYGPELDSRMTMVQNILTITRNHFGLSNPTVETGITPPPSLQWRKQTKRVIIHPTSAEHCKNWPIANFLKLAKRLASRPFEVVFIMSEKELDAWRPKIGRQFPVIGFPNLHECAAFIYESGFFIGNDSGGGHLAACLHIPTLSLHGRKGKSRLWRPDWGTVEVISPAFNLIGNGLRQKCWKYLLSVGRVQRAFEKLARRSPAL
jgi:heptosyltransferase-3